MATHERVLIVGGVAAGMSAAAKIRRMSPEAEIVAFERGAYISYAACGLPWFLCGLISNENSLIARSPEQFAKVGIKTAPRHEVTEIDVPGQRVRVRDLSEETEAVYPYDRLLLATGSQAVKPPIPGVDLYGVFQLRTLEDGLALRHFLRTEQPKRAVIAGGGYIGLEVV
jgi:NADPH-dependent 2,4-dienoyl-CoA reductase/sulfur reductase-like enzyme